MTTLTSDSSRRPHRAAAGATTNTEMTNLTTKGNGSTLDPAEARRLTTTTFLLALLVARAVR
jgi:hypothetical protein